MTISVKSEKELISAVAEGKTIVDVWAEWCPPCKAVEPVLKTVEYETDYKIVKVDADEAMEVAKFLGVSSLPTLIIFEDGQELNRIIGAVSKSQLMEKL